MIRIVLLAVFVCVFSFPAICDDPPGFNPGDEQPIPIDGGVLVLLASGAAYGLKKIRDQRSKSDSSDSIEEDQNGK
ncbi:MAG TPA: hypothetical protein PK509_11260 [Catalimonadaceae bacterium]|nr:hypothetical protein [Catalimonadaceae bacterium]